MLAIKLDDSFVVALETLCEKQGLSKTQVVKQALRLYQFVYNHAEDGDELTFKRNGEFIPMTELNEKIQTLEGEHIT